jgi:hypothetical protein
MYAPTSDSPTSMALPFPGAQTTRSLFGSEKPKPPCTAMLPVYRRLLADDLVAEIAAEEAREQDERSRTNDLWITTVEDQEQRTEPTNVTYISDYVRRERPHGRMRWEMKNPGPSEGRGSNPCLLVAGAGFEPATSGL